MQVVPRCPRCPADEPLAIMKPDIVFFGENLPEQFHRAMKYDKNEVDLLIVIGSSLKVRPVALIPSKWLSGNTFFQKFGSKVKFTVKSSKKCFWLDSKETRLSISFSKMKTDSLRKAEMQNRERNKLLSAFSTFQPVIKVMK